MNDDMLRDSLAQISEQAKQVDFLDRSLSRSKRIGRNRALTASAAALVALALAGGLVWQLGTAGTKRAAPGVELTATPTAAESPTASLSPSATQSPSSAPPVAGSVAGLPGWLYYETTDAKVLRLTQTGTVTVLSNDNHTANVSPDGASIAYVDGTDVVVTDRDGKHPRTVLRGTVGVGYEPVWSADSQRLLAAKGDPATGAVTLGVITLATGSFAALAHPLQDFIHPLWSNDGHHIGYATGTCGLGTVDIDGVNARAVPVLGDTNTTVNPQRRRSCDPYSISPDGTLIAVEQHTGDEPDGDIGRGLFANTIIDTATGDNVTLPVTGTITAIRFQPNGDILVRTTGQLTLLGPDHTIKAQVTEPSSVKNAGLLAYTTG